MKVVLVTRIKNLGVVGDVVDVKSGFARNFLIPSKKALPATEDNLKGFEERKEEYLKLAADELSMAEANSLKLDKVKIEVKANTLESGMLYGSVGASEIVSNLENQKIDFVKKSSITLPNGPIKELGEFTVNIELHPEIVKSIIVEVIPA